MAVDSERFAIDLWLEKLPGSERVRLAGKVLLQTSPLEDFHEVPVLILSDIDSDTEASSDSEGGFQLELGGNKTRFSLLLKQERAVIVPANGHKP